MILFKKCAKWWILVQKCWKMCKK